jgi:hypothetical protein
LAVSRLDGRGISLSESCDPLRDRVRLVFPHRRANQQDAASLTLPDPFLRFSRPSHRVTTML